MIERVTTLLTAVLLAFHMGLGCCSHSGEECVACVHDCGQEVHTEGAERETSCPRSEAPHHCGNSCEFVAESPAPRLEISTIWCVVACIDAAATSANPTSTMGWFRFNTPADRTSVRRHLLLGVLLI